MCRLLMLLVFMATNASANGSQVLKGSPDVLQIYPMTSDEQRHTCGRSIIVSEEVVQALQDNRRPVWRLTFNERVELEALLVQAMEQNEPKVVQCMVDAARATTWNDTPQRIHWSTL